MDINSKNNVFFKLGAGITTSTVVLNVKDGKEALLPPVPFRLTLTKFSPLGIVIRREIVLVTNVTGNICTATRAYEACPINDSSTTHVQTPYAFDEDDTAFVSMTAGMASEVNLRLPKSGGQMTGAILRAKGASIALASTVDLSTATGNIVHVTAGTGPITSFGTLAAGGDFTIVLDVAATITHNATSLIIPGGASISGQIGDRFSVHSEGSGNWAIDWYQKANGQAIISSVDINGLTTVTTLAEVDKLMAYSVSNTANRGITLANFRLLVQEFGGNGSDGAVDGTADLIITGSNNTHIIKNFTSFAAGNMPSQAYTNDPAA